MRPVADVYIKGRSGAWIKFHPYIDSGADITLLPKSLGELLGLTKNNSQIRYLGGIRGSVPIIYKQTHMRIGNVDFPAEIAWALIETVPPLLGRIDVFDVFTVTFKQTEGSIEFKEK